jgi:3-oxoacyl-[acyl-carrier protein] reductase
MAESSTEFTGRAMVIVGGSIGVGPAVVEAFLERGARVASGEEGDGHPASLPMQARAIPLDLATAESRRAFLDRCEAELGGLDVLVMSARPFKTAKILDTAPDHLARVIEEELIQIALCLQEAARRMAARGRGRIISFVSMSGKTGVHQGAGPYAAAKGGLITFSRVLAAELASTGVTVNCIATALLEPQVAPWTEERRREVAQEIPVRRFGRAVEAAHAVLYLASDKGGYVTGETMNLSGGRFMD